MFFLATFSSTAFSLCKEGTMKDLRKHKNTRDMVYFASWCQSCVSSITESDPSKDIYLAVFDEQEAANDALKYVLGNKTAHARCIWDKSGEIAKSTGVSNLPKTLKYQDINK